MGLREEDRTSDGDRWTDCADPYCADRYPCAESYDLCGNGADDDDGDGVSGRGHCGQTQIATHRILVASSSPEPVPGTRVALTGV